MLALLIPFWGWRRLKRLTAFKPDTEELPSEPSAFASATAGFSVAAGLALAEALRRCLAAGRG